MKAALQIRIKEVGKVRMVKKLIARVSGMSNFMNSQLLDFSCGAKGMIVGFDKSDILVLILGNEAKVRLGEDVYNAQEELKIPAGEGFLGRIVNALGEPVDGKGQIVNSEECIVDREKQKKGALRSTLSTLHYPVFRNGPETMDRGEADSFLETGTKIIDAVVPISKGQRQLVVGDRMTGKTTIAIDAILHQKGKDVLCIYCCIGKSFSSLLKVTRLLKAKSALNHTIIVAATASSAVGEQYLAPYSAAALAEYFMHKSRDVLLILDDMTKHGWSYRQLSLLLERPPGREAYSGDIYYVHSQLIERAGKLNKELGGGSITLFAIADTLQGDVTGYIPSNLISMTDGQIYLSSSLFAEGLRPAVDISLSVSIIGAKTQSPILKRLSSNVRSSYARYRELQRLTKLKTDLTPEAKQILNRGEAIRIIFAQQKNAPVSTEELIVLLYALDKKILDELDTAKLNRFKNEIWGYVMKNNPQLVENLSGIKELTDELETELDGMIVGYFKEIA